MQTTSQGASAPERVTARQPFFLTNPTQQLFEVRGGVPLIDAIESAGALLCAADEAAKHACTENDHVQNPHSMWAASYLIEMARAAIDACAQALMDESSDHV